MEEKDFIRVKNKDGIEEAVEVVLTIHQNNKEYLLYRNKNNELFASYVYDDEETFHNDLTDEEYDMLEKIYRGVNNDK